MNRTTKQVKNANTSSSPGLATAGPTLPFGNVALPLERGREKALIQTKRQKPLKAKLVQTSLLARISLRLAMALTAAFAVAGWALLGGW